jgi:energy-coupling factor transporter ATP-binding protein EcfA2
MPDSTAALEIDGLTVRYPGADRDALHELALEVAPGELVSIAGPNGAGKSTLCLVSAGLLPLVVRAEVRGSVAGPTPVGLVLSDPAAGLTGARASVREEVAFGLENLGVARPEMAARIDRALAALDIEALANRAPETLSGGEQQRVAIAAALAMEPPLLVLDEATAELDPAAAAGLVDVLRSLAAGGTAILAADHASRVLRASDRLVVLEDGLLVADAPPATGLAHLALAATAAIPVAWTPLRGDVRPATVEIRALSFRYPGRAEALRDVSLSIPAGQAVAIVGMNGSGKSTLAKLILGLLRPTTGSVAIDGRDAARLSGREMPRTTGSVFQDPRDQLFGRTVERAVAFGPRNLGIASDEGRALVNAALEATGLTGRRTANPHDLDVAARKQVALAGALAMDPGLVVFDHVPDHWAWVGMAVIAACGATSAALNLRRPGAATPTAAVDVLPE